jgi:hypothetical protein
MGGHMRKTLAAGVVLIVSSALFLSALYAENGSNELQEGRFVLVMMNGRAIKNTRVPSLILDSYRGIVWTCQNLQDGKPLWVKTDLGRHGSADMNKKRYVARMLEWQDADLRMPAVVLDIDTGIVWNCPNIVDGKATWIKMDLSAELSES